MNKTERLKKIKEEVVALTESPLYKERVENKAFPVIGEGNHNADVMFIGEAPGAREAATGRPFCGSAGKILTEMLEKIGVRREDVYITNILKDRPPKNRDPLPEEIKIYTPFLERQIEVICPRIIVCLGRFASEYILEKFNLKEEIKPISVIHGNILKGEANYGQIKIIPLMHPAVAVYNQSKKKVLLEGFLSLKKAMSEKK